MTTNPRETPMSSRSWMWMSVGLVAAGYLWMAVPAQACMDHRQKEKREGSLREACGCMKPDNLAQAKGPGEQVGQKAHGHHHAKKHADKPPVACNQGGNDKGKPHGKPGGFQQGLQQVCKEKGKGKGGPGQQVGHGGKKQHGPKKEAVACGGGKDHRKPGGFNQGMQQVGCGNKQKGHGKPQQQPGQCVGKPKKGPPQVAMGPQGNKGPKGNNGVGNGFDPQPRGNPPINDGRGAGPGHPGNRGGPMKGAGFVGFAPGKANKGPKSKK